MVIASSIATISSMTIYLLCRAVIFGIIFLLFFTISDNMWPFIIEAEVVDMVIFVTGCYSLDIEFHWVSCSNGYRVGDLERDRGI